MIRSSQALLGCICLPALFLFHATRAEAKFVPIEHPMVRTNAAEHVAWRTITIKPNATARRIHFYDKLNPVWWFKNSDDPKPPDWYKPGDTHRRLKWSFRNPLHNFDFYVIGVADKRVHRSGQFPEKNSDPRGGWDFEATRYKIFYLPFISYHRPKFDFYFGWRNHGNFGIKFNVNPTRPPKTTSGTKGAPPTDGDDAPAN